MNLNTADTGLELLRQDLHHIPGPHLPGKQGACNHSAKSLHGKDPVHWETKGSFARMLRKTLCQILNGLLQTIQPLTCGGRYRDNRGLFEECPLHKIPDLFHNQFQPFLFHQVRLGHSHQTRFDTQKTADIQMFSGLGHNSLISSYHQQNQIHAHNTRHHMVHKFFVAGHIDDADSYPIREIQIGKTQFNGDPSGLLLL